jgi:hypothetical protein
MNNPAEGRRVLRGQEGRSGDGHLLWYYAFLALAIASGYESQQVGNKPKMPEVSSKAPIVTVDEQKDTVTCGDFIFKGKAFEGSVQVSSTKIEDRFFECNFPAK